MQISEFRRELGRQGVGPGARWLKADFHIHCPGSSDYEYKEMDALERLGEELTDGEYDVAVILKHEEFPTASELEALGAFAPRTTLLPGAEINVFVDAMSKKVNKDHFFHAIVVADPDRVGSYTYALEKAKNVLTYQDGAYPAGFKSSIRDVGRLLRDEGALFIPAHLHQSKRPEVSRSIDDIYEDQAFLGFVRDGAFDALEVRQVSTASFFDGTKETNEGLPIPEAACVASSDAHHHQHIAKRNRCTWLRAENPTFQEVRAALSFPHRVLLHKPFDSHPRVVGLHVVGSFVPDIWLGLNEGLNALIGSKGTGKTALLECLRFVLGTPVPDERREPVQRHLNHVLGAAGYVECLVQLPDGTDRVITRRADSPERIAVVAQDGVSQTMSPEDDFGFPIAILGWHEIEAVADSPAARIDLLDRIGERARIRSWYAEVDEIVTGAREELPLLQGQMRRLAARLKELWDLRGKRMALSKLQEGELLELHDQYEWFLSAEENLRALAADAKEAVSGVEGKTRTGLDFDHKAAPEEVLGDALGAVASLAGTLEALREHEKASASALKKAASDVGKTANETLDALSRAFAQFRDDVYRPRVETLAPEERDVLARHIQVLEETKRLPTVERVCRETVSEVRAIATTLRTKCEEVIERRKEIASARESLVEQLNDELGDVRLQFLPNAVTASRDRFRNRHGETAKEMVDYLGEFDSAGPYAGLKSLFERLEALSVDEEKFDFRELLWDVRLLDLLDVIDEDDVRISLSVGSAGYVEIQNLSSGQRSVAVFPLLLRNERGPLIIDQPEDNLDNRYIAKVIAPDLLSRKATQQFLVTSHNANLVVLTDADLIVEMDSDGTRCTVAADGFLASVDSVVRSSVLDVLDGGEEALIARQHKYGLGGRTVGIMSGAQ